MLHIVRIALVCSAVYGEVSVDGQLAADWSHFDVVGQPAVGKSADVIKSLPMHQYWDGLKGTYRTGVIADMISESHPNLVTRISQKAGSKAAIDEIALDSTSVFDNNLVTLQGLIQYASEIDTLLHEYQQRKMGLLAQNQRKMANFTSKADMVAHKEILELKLASIEKLIEVRELKRGNKLNNIQYHTNESWVQHQQLDSHLKVGIQGVYEGKKALTGDRVAALLAIYSEVEEDVLGNEVRILHDEFEASLGAMEREVNTSLEALAFRHSEQLAAVKASEAIERRILTVKAESLGQSTSSVVDAVFSEIVALAEALFRDPWELLLYFRYLALAIFVVVGALELFVSVKGFLTDRFFSKQKLKPSGVRLTPSAAAALLCSGKVVLDHQTRADIDYCLSSITTAAKRRSALPNLLVSGPAGCGKTTVAQMLTAASALPVVVLSGNDLLSLGNQGGLYLRTLMHKSVASKRQTLLLIEDADAIVAARRSLVTEGGSSVPPSASCCLYSLLEGIRESSPHFAVVLTTRLASPEVDSAILDRMDGSLRLPSPSDPQKLLFVRVVFEEEFLALLDPASLAAYRGTYSSLTAAQLYSRCAAFARQGSLASNNSPETDCPDVSPPASASSGAAASATASFDAGLCFQQLLEISEGWSFRDLKKFLLSTRFSVLANERCQLTSALWSREVAFHVQQHSEELGEHL